MSNYRESQSWHLNQNKNNIYYQTNQGGWFSLYGEILVMLTGMLTTAACKDSLSRVFLIMCLKMSTMSTTDFLHCFLISLPIFPQNKSRWNVYFPLCSIINHGDEKFIIIRVLVSHNYSNSPGILSADHLKFCFINNFLLILCKDLTLDTNEQSPLSTRAIFPSISSEFWINPQPHAGSVGTNWTPLYVLFQGGVNPAGLA